MDRAVACLGTAIEAQAKWGEPAFLGWRRWRLDWTSWRINALPRVVWSTANVVDELEGYQRALEQWHTKAREAGYRHSCMSPGEMVLPGTEPRRAAALAPWMALAAVGAVAWVAWPWLSRSRRRTRFGRS